MNDYDVIVVGAGHAGIEAAMACARMGSRCLMITLRADSIGLMSCNPAIGGVGKGQLVKEIDALGGKMAEAADACGIQFRILNASKGPAVQSSRAQIDKERYRSYMCSAVRDQTGLELKEAEVVSLITQGSACRGVVTSCGERISSRAVVLCPGTFLEGLIHIGMTNFGGGRINEPPCSDIVGALRKLGLKTMRFKTGTCPRLRRDSIDFSVGIPQEGDPEPRPFSFFTGYLPQRQVPCYLTYTNERTHSIIRSNLHRSPLYAGVIHATGVRYCPSIEDKVVKFSAKERHQIFLEPEGIDSQEIYPNGLSTSLPEDVQLEMVRSVKGLENAEIIRPGYGIEHTVIDPTQLYPTLEVKLIPGLFLAGQINGTTGYEEAGAQGLLAGINAALRSRDAELLVLDRSSSYLGVLVDDLTTKGTAEPYRMFTSRVEYRLLLREDNADVRLSLIGQKLGLLREGQYSFVQERIKALKEGVEYLRRIRVKPSVKIAELIAARGLGALEKSVSVEEFLRRPGVDFSLLQEIGVAWENIPVSARRLVETEIKYSGFIRRQEAEVQRFRNLEKIRIPDNIDYALICGLSREIKEKLTAFRPLNLGQATRISGVTPAAISLLMIFLRKPEPARQGLRISRRRRGQPRKKG